MAFSQMDRNQEEKFRSPILLLNIIFEIFLTGKYVYNCFTQ